MEAGDGTPTRKTAKAKAESTSGGWEVTETEDDQDHQAAGVADDAPLKERSPSYSVSDSQRSGGSDQLDALISEVVDEECKSDDQRSNDGSVRSNPEYRRGLDKDYDSDDECPSTSKQVTPRAQDQSRKTPPTTCGKRERIKQALADYMRANRQSNRDSTDAIGHPAKRAKNIFYGSELGKFIRPEPFPVGVPHDTRWSTWIDWKVQFEAALAVSGRLTQNEMANHLFLSVGSDLRQIINAYGMKPEVAKVPADYPFYDKLVEGLDRHFEGSSDATVDMKNLMGMSQKEHESVRDFHVRLMLQARVCFKRNFVGGEYTELLRDRLVGGLRNREVANMAFLNEWGIEKVVEVAARSETLQLNKKLMAEMKPLAEVFEVKAEVSPLQERRPDLSNRVSKSSRSGRDSKRPARAPKSGEGFRRGPAKCKDCGLERHRTGSCPAIGQECRECHEIGHYAAACNRRINEVSASSESKSEVN